MGGFVKLQYGVFDRQYAPSARDGALLDGEAHLNVADETDTGAAYGARLQLAPAAKPRDNGSYIHAEWAWGQIRIGDYGGAAKELTISAPTIGVGQIDGDFDRLGAPSALIAPYKLDNDDSVKLTYLSPVILGFRAGVSYTPELSGGQIEIVRQRLVNRAARHRNVVELAASSARDIGDVAVTVSGAFVSGGSRPDSHLHDLAGGSAGLKVAWNGFIFGGGFVYDGAATLAGDDRPGHRMIDSIVDEINLGLAYESGRWKVGASWAHDDRNAAQSSDIAAIGVDYRAFQGVTFSADLARFTEPRPLAIRERTALIVETALHF